MTAHEQQWSIGELASRAGLNPSAIRYYERIGLMPTADRVSGKRRYDESALTRLTAIDVAQRAGFTLAETRTLLAGATGKTTPSERWRMLAEQKLSEVDALIERAYAMKRLLHEGIDCGCIRLDQCELLLTNGRAPVVDSARH